MDKFDEKVRHMHQHALNVDAEACPMCHEIAQALRDVDRDAREECAQICDNYPFSGEAAAMKIRKEVMPTEPATLPMEKSGAATPPGVESGSGRPLEKMTTEELLERLPRSPLNACREDYLTSVAEIRRRLERLERMTDLVRYQRGKLYEAELITYKEYAELVRVRGAVQRIEGYDAVRKRLAKCEAAIQAALDRDNELHPEHCPCELCAQLRAALEDR